MSDSVATFHFCKIILAPKESYYLMHLYCLKCHEIFGKSAEDWLMILRQPHVATVEDEGSPFLYAIVYESHGRAHVASMTRKPLDASYPHFIDHELFCKPNDKMTP